MQSIALQKQLASPHQDTPRTKRKNSDDDYFVEETLFFTYSPSTAEDSPTKKGKSSIEELHQASEYLSEFLLIKAHRSKHFFTSSTSHNEEDSDDEEDAREARLMQVMMANPYPDAEIDKLLETFKISGKNDILNGEFIENDIRLSESIREAIEEIK